MGVSSFDGAMIKSVGIWVEYLDSDFGQMTVSYVMSFRSYGFRPQELISIGEWVENGVIGLENGPVVFQEVIESEVDQ